MNQLSSCLRVLMILFTATIHWLTCTYIQQTQRAYMFIQ